VRGGAERVAKEAQEMVTRDVRLARQVEEPERLGLVLVQVVARPAQPAKDVVVEQPERLAPR